MLFLHGLGGNRHSFDAQIDALRHHYRCVAWDAPGYGDSKPMDEMSFDALAQCVDNLLECLEVEPFAVIGHSMGGMVAQTWLAQGGTTDKLVLAQTSARFGKPGSRWNEEFLTARLQPLDQGLKPADFARNLITSMFHDTQKTAAIEAGIATMAPLPATVYRQVINCLVTFDEADNLRNISVPTLCLAAEYDTTAPAQGLQQMADVIPKAKFHCLPDAGHLAYIETPQEFTQALQDFLGA